jgi:hypothetical protein
MANQKLLAAAKTWMDTMNWETRHNDAGRLQARRTPSEEWRSVSPHTMTKVRGVHYFGWTDRVIHVCLKDEQYDMVQELQRKSSGRSFDGVPILWVEGEIVVEAWHLDPPS